MRSPLLYPPVSRPATDFGAPAPPDVGAAAPRGGEPAVCEFHRPLAASSPWWVTGPQSPWPVSVAAPAPRFLVHQARFHAGDTLWLTPLLRAIRELFPAAEIIVVGPPAAPRVLAGNPRVTAIVPYPAAGGEDDRRRVLDVLGRIDAALFAFARRPESRWLARAAAARGVPVRVNLEYFDTGIDPRRIAPWATHEAWFFWSSLASPQMLLHALDPFLAAARSFDREVEMFPSPAARRRAAAALEARGLAAPYVVLAPGGRSSERWPAPRFAALAAWLADRGMGVLVEGSRDEESLVRAVADAATARARRRIHAATDPLDELAALVGGARLLVANDSAPIHVAEAMGTPSLYFAERAKLVHSHPAGVSWALFDPLENRIARISVAQACGALEALLYAGSPPLQAPPPREPPID